MAEKTPREIELEAQLAEAKAARSVAEGQLTAALTEMQSVRDQAANLSGLLSALKTELSGVRTEFAEMGAHMAQLHVERDEYRRKFNYAVAMLRELKNLTERFHSEFGEGN